MKKRFAFVLSVIMVICTLSIALVACQPKDPDPFNAVDKEAELGKVWDMWAEKNVKVTGDTLGLDVKLNLKDANTDLGIALLGGITQNTSEADKEGFCLSISNNKKEGSNKNVVEVIVAKSAIYLSVDGLSDKPIRLSGEIPNIGDLLPISPAALVSTLKGILVPIISQTVDNITIDPVKNDKTYDVKYNFDINVCKVVDAIVELVGELAEISDDVDSIIGQIKGVIGDLKLAVAVNSTGNTREKVVKPAKGEPKYSYSGGSLTSLAINAVKDGNTMTVENNIKLQNTIPSITIPTDAIDFEKILFPSNLNGAVVLKDKDNAVVSTYNYTVNIDFEVEQLLGSVIDCISQKNAMPLLNKMFKDGKGKIFVEVSHECGDKCQIEHISDKSRPVLTVAYDPSTFDTSRVYVALNLNGILPAKLSEALAPVVGSDLIGVVDGLLKTIPYEDVVFSIDPTAYMAMENAKTGNLNVSNKALTAVSDIITSDNGAININFEEIFNGILNIEKLSGLQYYAQLSDGILSVDFAKTIKDILNLDAIADAKEIVEDIVALMFPNVTTLDINAVYSNEHIDTEWNIKDKFVNNREFTYTRNEEVINTPYNNTCEICQGKGYMEFWGQKIDCQNIESNPTCSDGRQHNEATNIKNVTEEKVIPINSKITYNKNAAGLLDITTGIELYNQDGTQNIVCYEEVMALVGSTVTGAYTDLKGNAVTNSKLRILDIVGLDRNIVGKSQTAYIVVGGELGNSWYNFAQDFLGVVNMASAIIGLPDMSDIINYRFVDDVIAFDVTLTEVEKLAWSQSGDESQKIDETNVYERGTILNTNFDFTITYVGGSEKKVENITSPDASGKFASPSGVVALTYGSSFTMTYTAFGAFTKTVAINMDETKYALTGTVDVAVGVNTKYTNKINDLVNKDSESTSVWLDTIPSNEAVQELIRKYGDAVTATAQPNGSASIIDITFNKVGTYEFKVVAREGVIVTITFNVTENVAE